MTQSNPASDSAAAARPEAAASGGAGQPGKPARREIFSKLPDRGAEGGPRAPEIYPALQLPSSGHSVERCGTCLMAKELCAC